MAAGGVGAQGAVCAAPAQRGSGAGRRPTATRSRLDSITIEGYKSLASCKVEFGDVTVLLGANGSGKSNLVSFFQMLGFVSTSSLQLYIGREGGPESLLRYGAGTTSQMRATIKFGGIDGTHDTTTTYHMRLMDAAPATMVFAEERAEYRHAGCPEPQSLLLGSGHAESRLQEKRDEGDKRCGVLLSLLSSCRGHHFCDTSSRANIRKSGYIEDNRHLRDDAGNLAAFLHGLERTDPERFRRIEETVRLAFPAFGGFVLGPRTTDPSKILLNWRGNGHEYPLGPHQISDGTLRFVALAALFLQPRPPNVIVLDEPELGLHPSALVVLAAMAKSAATKVQVILATQSSRLVDEFKPSQIAVLESDADSGTKCKRLDEEALSEWLEDYSLGELWEKNLFGGRP